MKILFHYLKPHKWLVVLILFLATINMGFSLIDPYIFGRVVDLANSHYSAPGRFDWNSFLFTFSGGVWGVVPLLIASITVAMVSRIAKNFQDYFLQVVVQKFGARVFTDGLQHAMKLPYQEFEDQRSGETLSVLQKVRADTEKFMNYLINILFSVLIGILFVCIYAIVYIQHWS